MTRAELKSMSKEQIKGNLLTLFLISLIVYGLSALCGAIPVIGSLASAFVLTPAFAIAQIMIYLELTKGTKPEVGDILKGFNHFWIAFKTTFLTGLFVMLWSLLLYVPGIIKACSYSQAMYIVAENPEIGAREAIDQSKAMMEGHKMDYFLLVLSFFGWALLGALTFGILYIWLIPYMQTTFANFYNSIKPAAIEEPTYLNENF